MYISQNGIILRFLPSIQEVEESALTNPYMGGLEEFNDSVELLLNSINELNHKHKKRENYLVSVARIYTKVGMIRGQSRHGLMPPEYIEWSLNIGITGIAVAFYELLKIWVQKKNGRKIRVRINNIEIEASQMTPQEFKEFFDSITKQNQNIDCSDDDLIKIMESKGYKILNPSSETYKDEIDNLHKTVKESILKARSL